MGEVLSVPAPTPEPTNNNTWWGKAKSMAGKTEPEKKEGVQQVSRGQVVNMSHTR